MEESNFLLYGAYGYTGRLITRYAKDYGLRPILAGRNESKLRELSEETGFNYLVFDLEDTHALIHALQKVPVVLHAAGPFIHTAGLMIEACLETKTHYLDITGEIEVFELANQYGPAAEQNEIMLMPGVGFDVVPTDCMARYLSDKMPDATHLELAFAMKGGRTSRGTANTMIEGLGDKGCIRKNGQITAVRLGHDAKVIPFAEHYERFAMAIPWGDVSTAYYTTGIPNIVTYTKASTFLHRSTKVMPFVAWILRMNWVRNIFRQRVQSGPAGPSDEERSSAKGYVWGQVSNAAGKQIAARFQGPEGYTITAHASLIIVQKVISGNCFAGFQTPAGAYGSDLIMEVEGTSREDLD